MYPKGTHPAYVNDREGILMGFTIITPPKKSAVVKHMPACKGCKKSLPVGKNRHNLFRSLIEFDLSPLPPQLTILNATLHLYITKNTACLANTVKVHQILSKWCERCLSFRHQPLFNYDPAACATIPSRHNSLASFELTALIRQWYHGAEANWGVLLKTANEDLPGEVVFASNLHAGLKPYLCIEYLNSSPVDKPCRIPLDITLPVNTHSTVACTNPVTTFMFNYTYTVVNTGSAPAIAFLQISPDGNHWETNGEVKTVCPGEQKSFVPDYIIKYSRLCYHSAPAEPNTTLVIYIQGWS